MPIMERARRLIAALAALALVASMAPAAAQALEMAAGAPSVSDKGMDMPCCASGVDGRVMTKSWLGACAAVAAAQVSVPLLLSAAGPARPAPRPTETAHGRPGAPDPHPPKPATTA